MPQGDARLSRVPARVVVIDNYDSFTFNLVQYIETLGARADVRLNDRTTVAEVQAAGADGVLLSPGPGTPDDAGITLELIARLAGEVPLLGVCLGHQAIAQAYGGKVVRAERLMHGKTSPIEHDGRGVFQGLPSPFAATRYHSLLVQRSSVASLPGNQRPHRGRRDHGPAPPGAPGGGRTVPSREHPHRARADADEELADNAMTAIGFAEVYAELESPGGISRATVRRVFDAILAGEWTPVQVAGFAVALRLQGESAEIDRGCRRVPARGDGGGRTTGSSA